jgi:hypothetical protein
MTNTLNRGVAKSKAMLSKVIQFTLALFRGFGLSRDIVSAQFNVRTHKGPRVFNLDLHVSIIADLKMGAEPLNLSITNWSISGSNRVFRKILWVPDPVRGINATNWQNINADLIQEFTRHYRSFLQSFDGFIATYPPAFAQIYESFDKPVLAVAGTRYEWPLTGDRNLWSQFDQYIQAHSTAGDLLIAANNLGDADYLKYSTGVTPRYVPSLCDYTGQSWNGIVSEYLVIARSDDLIEEVRRLTDNLWVDSRRGLGKNYSWSDLARGKALFVVPYNISTMSLFELATMGVPVIVPSSKLLKSLRQKFTGVLSELSFMEMNSMNVSDLEEGNPNNFLSSSYLDWWIERADFYNSDLMPNVSVIDRLEQLNDIGELFDKHLSPEYRGVISQRNNLIRDQRHRLLQDFTRYL